MAHNRTTLDAYRSPQFDYGSDRNGFDLGVANNFYQVFGHDWTLWGVPVFTSEGNGWSFPTRADADVESSSSEGNRKKPKRLDETERLITK